MIIMRIATALSLTLGFLAAPLPVEAEQPTKIYKLGFLMGMDRQPAWTAAFEQGLETFGWSPGRNVEIEYRSAEGDFDRLPTICADLVGHGVDLILAVSAPETAAAKRCTSTVPIVFAIHGDPVGTGDVESLAHPGGNATGMSQSQGELVSKLLDLLKKAVPSASRVAVLWNATNPYAALVYKQTQAAGRTLGIEVQSLEVRSPDDFDSAFDTVRQQRSDALITVEDPLTGAYLKRIVEFAAINRLPSLYGFRENVLAGGLMSYGANFADLFRRAAGYVDKILKGVKPADLPVQQPTKFELVINLKTAKALGLVLPASVLARADEVIE